MNSLKNHFLISVPHLKDPFFEKSVVYLCEHDKKGAMGLIINKAIKKNNIIKECYKKAEHYINLASNSLSVFEESDEKNVLKNLTSFSIERNF